MKKIGIIDCGLGNILSVHRMLSKVGHPAIISSDISVLEGCAALILPGVGAYDYGMTRLREYGLVDFILDRALNHQVPLLGICLGMQLLFEQSEEGDKPGLGLLKGQVKRFRFPPDQELPVPHMGWNTVRPSRRSRLFPGDEVQRFYFVHSYHVVPEELSAVSAECLYGYEFTCAVENANIMGVQFHPEKSHRFGMNLMQAFGNSLESSPAAAHNGKEAV